MLIQYTRFKYLKLEVRFTIQEFNKAGSDATPIRITEVRDQYYARYEYEGVHWYASCYRVQ